MNEKIIKEIVTGNYLEFNRDTYDNAVRLRAIVEVDDKKILATCTMPVDMFMLLQTTVRRYEYSSRIMGGYNIETVAKMKTIASNTMLIDYEYGSYTAENKWDETFTLHYKIDDPEFIGRLKEDALYVPVRNYDENQQFTVMTVDRTDHTIENDRYDYRLHVKVIDHNNFIEGQESEARSINSFVITSCFQGILRYKLKNLVWTPEADDTWY